MAQRSQDARGCCWRLHSEVSEASALLPVPKAKLGGAQGQASPPHGAFQPVPWVVKAPYPGRVHRRAGFSLCVALRFWSLCTVAVSRKHPHVCAGGSVGRGMLRAGRPGTARPSPFSGGAGDSAARCHQPDFAAVIRLGQRL